MAKTKLAKKVTAETPSTEISTPSTETNVINETPATDAVIKPEVEDIFTDFDEKLPGEKVAPKDLAEAQDMAEQAGIDYVGKTLDQLTSELTGGVPPSPKKKLVKVKKSIEVPTNVDPAIKAAIDKANAEIAIAQAKVAEAKEQQKKAKDEAKAKAEAEKAERIAKINAEKAAKEAEAKKATEELEARKAEATKYLEEAEKVVAEKQAVVERTGQELKDASAAANLATQELKDAISAANGWKSILGQKVATVKTSTGTRVGTKVVDMTKYEVGQTYTVSNKGTMVEATCKCIINGGADRKKFYKFKETVSGNVFHIRAYAEDNS
jgi:hypothetical protein